MICPNCGFKANDNDRFCMHCATKLITDEEYAAMTAAADSVGSAMDEAVNDMGNAVDNAEEALDNAVSEEDKAIDSAEEALDNAADEVKEDVEKAVEEAADEAEKAVEEVKEDAAAAVDEAVEEIDKAVDDVNEELHEAEAEAPAVPVVTAEPAPAAECCRGTDKPLTTWGYLWRILLFSIPIFGMIPLFVMAFSSGINKNSRGLARAVLIIILVLFILACAGVIYALIAFGPDAITAYINKVYVALTGK